MVKDIHEEYKNFIAELKQAVAEGRFTQGMDDLTKAVVKIDKGIEKGEEFLEKQRAEDLKRAGKIKRSSLKYNDSII